MKILGTHKFVIRRRMMLGVIVGRVVSARTPVQIELFGGDAVTKPMMAHVKRFGAFHANLCSEDTESG